MNQIRIELFDKKINLFPLVSLGYFINIAY